MIWTTTSFRGEVNLFLSFFLPLPFPHSVLLMRIKFPNVTATYGLKCFLLPLGPPIRAYLLTYTERARFIHGFMMQASLEKLNEMWQPQQGDLQEAWPASVMFVNAHFARAPANLEHTCNHISYIMAQQMFSCNGEICEAFIFKEVGFLKGRFKFRCLDAPLSIGSKMTCHVIPGLRVRVRRRPAREQETRQAYLRTAGRAPHTLHVPPRDRLPPVSLAALSHKLSPARARSSPRSPEASPFCPPGPPPSA